MVRCGRRKPRTMAARAADPSRVASCPPQDEDVIGIAPTTRRNLHGLSLLCCSALKVSPLYLGTMMFGDQTPDDEAFRIID